MINLITGLPGNGKTLFAIGFIKQWAEKDSRPVFYSGIKLTDKGKELLGWTEIEALEWFTVPPGSIVVIDESQRVFRPRSHGKDVPRHVAELETHRHQGIDLVLITQHPMLIDNEVRRLAGNHRHVVRKFGMQAATIHEWGEVRQDCEKPGRREDSQKTGWNYDKSTYELYVSAEVHTVKRSIPRRVWVLISLPFLLAALGWYAYSSLSGFGKPKIDPAIEAKAPGQTSAGGQTSQTKPEFDPIADARMYVSMNTPRVAGVPHTAPKYDEITKPTTAPVPVACIASKKQCQCYSQQGTRMEVNYNLCLDVAHNGFFEEFERDRERRGEAVAVLNDQKSLPISGVSTADRPPVYVFDGQGYGVLGGRVGASAGKS